MRRIAILVAVAATLAASEATAQPAATVFPLAALNEAQMLHGGGPYSGPSASSYSDLNQEITSLLGAAAKLQPSPNGQPTAWLNAIRTEMLLHAQLNNGVLDGAERAVILQRLATVEKHYPMLVQ